MKRVLANMINHAEIGIDVSKDFILTEVNFGLFKKRIKRDLTTNAFTAYCDDRTNVLHVISTLTKVHQRRRIDT